MIAITKDVWEKIKPRLEQEEVFINGVYQPFDDTLLKLFILFQSLQFAFYYLAIF